MTSFLLFHYLQQCCISLISSTRLSGTWRRETSNTYSVSSFSFTCWLGRWSSKTYKRNVCRWQNFFLVYNLCLQLLYFKQRMKTSISKTFLKASMKAYNKLKKNRNEEGLRDEWPLLSINDHSHGIQGFEKKQLINKAWWAQVSTFGLVPKVQQNLYNSVKQPKTRWATEITHHIRIK